MSKLKVEIEVFSNERVTYNEDGEAIAASTLEEAIVSAAAEKILGQEVARGEWGSSTVLRARLGKQVEERVRAEVDRLVVEFAGERVRAAVDAVLAQGWKRTDEYGHEKAAVTLSSRILEIINEKVGDGYSSSNRERPSRVDQAIKNAVEAALGKEFAPVIEAAREKFKAAVDGVVQAKLTATLRDALGIR